MFICKYCGKECKNKNSLAQHEIRCKENPNRIISYFCGDYNKTRKPTNKYIKAKELGLSIPTLSKEAKEKIGNIWRGKKLPEEMKQKISLSRKKYLEEHPDEIPFKLNHSSKQSYPEKYFEELFINENIPLKYHKQIGRYELDFYNDNLMKYVEIDGDQHNLPYMIKHDIERTEYLKQLGWEGIRIKWSEYKKSKNKENYINQIKEFII